MVTLAGAGLAGLAAAARLRELGHDVVVLEKGTRPGGSFLLSSGVIWRHRSLEAFREECPGGAEALQRAIVEQLDDRLDWLEYVAGPSLVRETRNPRTIGRRFDPPAAVEALVSRAGGVRVGQPLSERPEAPLIVATGGFAASLARELGVTLRAAPWSEGDGMRVAVAAGAATTGGMDEFYGRLLPAPPARVAEKDFVRLSQVYGFCALVLDEGGREIPGPFAWHESDLAQGLARRGGRGWFVLDDAALAAELRDGTVADRVDAVRDAGGTVIAPADLPFPVPPASRVAVHVACGVTHTLGGIRTDAQGRVLDASGRAIEGLYAAGVDVGGVATGGYASGLAQALVLGCAAAEAIAGG